MNGRHRGWRAALALVVVLVVVVAPVVQEYTAPTAPRYTLAAALWEHQTLELDRYAANVFIDRLEHDGHLYSDKAPGQPFLSVPAYVIARAAGAEPATVVRPRGNLGVWFVGVWSSLIPAVVILLLIFAAARPLGRRAAVAGAAGAAFGTLLLPYAAQVYGHVLGGALAFGAWRIVRAPELTWRRAMVAGLLAGTAVAVEYPIAIVVAVIGAWLALRHRSQLIPYAIGGIPPALAIGAYQWALFGNPFVTSYSEKPSHEEANPFITGLPDPIQGLEILFGKRGLFLFTPLVAAGVWGLIQLARRRDGWRDEAIVGLVVLAAFFLLQAGWPNPWGGSTPGPRYMIPALPFLGVGMAAAWSARPRLVTALGAISAFSMFWPLYARHFVHSGGWLIDSQLTDVNVAGFMPTLFTMAMGWPGWLVHAALLIVAVWWLEREFEALPDGAEPSHESLRSAR